MILPYISVEKECEDVVKFSFDNATIQVPSLIFIATVVIVVGAIVAIAVLTTLFVILRSKYKKSPHCCGSDDTCFKEKCISLYKKDMHYIEIIFAIIVIILLVNLFIGKKDALEYFSFASTITSIILSVLAIMMTIFSDAKNENTKSLINKSIDSLEKAIKTIEEHTQEMNNVSDKQRETFEKILENSSDILERTKGLEKSVKDLGVEHRRTDDFSNKEYKDAQN